MQRPIGAVRLHGARTSGGEELRAPGSLTPPVGPFERVVACVSGDEDEIKAAGGDLPRGGAWPEAVAVRLRRQGAVVEWGEPEGVAGGDVERRARERGRSSVAILRADPSLLTEMQAGGWFNASAPGRALRRVLIRVAPLRALAGRSGGRAARWAADAAFWRGVADETSEREWRRLTTSYVALVYHRLAGEGRPGQEDLDLAPERFSRQLRLLRALRFRPLTDDEVIAFHTDPEAQLPRRGYVLTVDDGFADCLDPLTRAAAHAPRLFVPAESVGATAWWAGGEPLAGWGELAELERSGVGVGSHGLTHARLPELGNGAGEALAEARAELGRRLERPVASLAYPHGAHDAGVRAAARAAGHPIAWTTAVGRNGAGTDPHCLRRIGPKERDSLASFTWKVATGELPPRRWERRRRARASSPGP